MPEIPDPSLLTADEWEAISRGFAAFGNDLKAVGKSAKRTAKQAAAVAAEIRAAEGDDAPVG